MKPRIQNIDFDNLKSLRKIQNDVVEIKVKELYFLLEYFYTGGGESSSLNKRLKYVMNNANSILDE